MYGQWHWVQKYILINLFKLQGSWLEVSENEFCTAVCPSFRVISWAFEAPIFGGRIGAISIGQECAPLIVATPHAPGGPSAINWKPKDTKAAQWFVMGTKLFFHFLFYAFNIVLGPCTVLFKYDCII